MVKQADIDTFISSLPAAVQQPVAVVVGGTNGIGRAFLQQLASHTQQPIVYIVGRNQATLDEISKELKALNANGNYISVHSGDLTLLSSVETASRQILQSAQKIDILYMSPGYLTFAGRDESSEGLDKVTAVRFQARFRFIHNLLPLLNASASPRVVSVLAGGLEGKIFPDDLALKEQGHYGMMNAANASATYTTLSLEQLQVTNPKVSFVHLFPGLVRTNLFNTEHFNAPFKFFMNWIFMPTIGRLMAMSTEDVGARTLYAATNPQFAASDTRTDESAIGSNGIKGSGVYTLNDKTDAVHNDKILAPYREQQLGQKIWQHTLDEYKQILG